MILWMGRRKKQDVSESLRVVAESVDRLGERLDRLEGRFDDLREAVAQQEGKVLRMQYKGTQEILDNLDNLGTNQRASDRLQEQLLYAEREQRLMLQCLLDLLDDLDLVAAKISGDGASTWKTLFNSWTKKIIAHLKDLGYREIPVLGREFSPLHSEAIGTVSQEDAAGEGLFACQVAEVIRRGFVYADGSLVRKARVITVEEGAGDMGEPRIEQRLGLPSSRHEAADLKPFAQDRGLHPFRTADGMEVWNRKSRRLPLRRKQRGKGLDPGKDKGKAFPTWKKRPGTGENNTFIYRRLQR